MSSDMATEKAVGDSVISQRKAGISIAVASLVTVLAVGWVFLGLLLDAPGVASAAMLAVVGGISSILFHRYGKHILGRCIWLITTNLAIFAGAYLIHPSGNMAIMLAPIAGVPFILFSWKNERPFVLAFSGLPVFLWILSWATSSSLIGYHEIGHDFAEKYASVASALTTFSLIAVELGYFAIDTAKYEHLLVEANSKIEARVQEFRDYADTASDWLWEMDDHLRFSSFSQRFEEITGIDSAMLIGKTREETGVVKSNPDAWRDHLSDLEARRPFRRFVYQREGEGGKLMWMSASGKPTFNEDGTFRGYRGVGNDISHRKVAALELEEAKVEAESANQAKSEFLSSMSHELRTPLNAVLGFSEILRDDIDQPLSEDQNDSVDHIWRAGRHLLTLINDILELSKIQEGKLEFSIGSVSVGPLLEDCVELINRQAVKANITIELQALTDFHVQADPMRLKQVILNLVSNAIKYNRPGGEVRISCDRPSAAIASISVSDTGLGITEENLNNLFQRFNRLGFESSAIEGTGIGLVITKSLVEAMDGSMEVKSEVGKGSTFSVCLPVMKIDEE